MFPVKYINWFQNQPIDQQDLSRCLFMARLRTMPAKLPRSMNQPQSASKLVLWTWSHTLAGCSHAGRRACCFCLPACLPLHDCRLSHSCQWSPTCSAKIDAPSRACCPLCLPWASVGWKGSKEKLSLLFRSGCKLCCRSERGEGWDEWEQLRAGLAQLCPERWHLRCGINSPSGSPQVLMREKIWFIYCCL